MRAHVILGFGFLGLSLSLFILAAPAREAGASAEEFSLPSVATVKTGPVIDGDLGDGVWQKALVVKLDNYCDRDRRDRDEKPEDATEAMLVTDRENLYVAFRSEESHPEGPWVYSDERLKRRGNAHVMGGDYVAVAVDLGRFGFYNYYMFFVNAEGEVYRCFTWPHRYDLVLHEEGLPVPKATAKVDKAGKVWTVELKIPLTEMLRYPQDGIPKIIGLDLRRVQWGADRGTDKLKVYWTGMANVDRPIKPQYDHMVTWKPLFESQPHYSTSYACGRGWVQLVFPESFGHVRLACGTLADKLVSGEGAKLIGLVDARTGWDVSRWSKLAKAFDAPRMEYWEDLRPQHPQGEPEVVMTPPVRKPGEAVKFAAGPTASLVAGGRRVSFELAAPTDVAVDVLDAEGRVVRHLGAGVLGGNPPEPFEAGSLAQQVFWDHRDDRGKAVAPGVYKVRVSAGLEPRFHYAIPLEKGVVDKDKWPQGLDVANMPNPKHAWPLGHHAWGRVNYMSVDRSREELYVQNQYVYDGNTGKKLRELKLSGPPPLGVKSSHSFGNGEVSFGPDGLVYVGASNDICRFNREGKPIPFGAVGRNFIPEFWGAHSNPHRGICVSQATGDIYKAHHYQPHTSYSLQVTQLGSDGRIKKYGFIEMRKAPGAGIKVDREGNVYVGCIVQPPDVLPPEDLGIPTKTRAAFQRLYGSILKFGPEGGIVEPDDKGKFVCPIGVRQPPHTGTKPYAVRGAKWVHPGYSPMLSRISDERGGPGCNCRNARFDLDDYGRLFIPDAVAGRVEVIDSNANTILFIGRRGGPEEEGAVFGWPSMVAVSDWALYVTDYLHYKVVRVRLEYAAQAQVEVKVGG